MPCTYNQWEFIINVHATALKIHHKLFHDNKAPVPKGFEATTKQNLFTNGVTDVL